MGIFPSLSKRRAMFAKKVFSLVLLFGLVVQPIAPSLFMSGFFISKAHAADESDAVAALDTEDVQDDTEEVETLEEEAAPAEASTPEASTEEAVLTESETTKVTTPEEKTTEEAVPAVEEKKEVATWQTEGSKATTTGPVALGVKYEAPQNKEVTVTFTKLPETPGTLTIEEITLTKEQVEKLGATSDKAYDITSSMENGSFEYDLTLPTPEGKDDLQVKYAEDVESLDKAKTVDEEDIKTEKDSIKAQLNHFTVFVVVYNTIPTPTPGSFPSVGFEATSTKELGDHITLGGTERNLNSITVSLTNWACENDYTESGGDWTASRGSTDPCVTTSGSSYEHPITLNVYSVDTSGPNPAVGSLITSKTINADIPFRPSYDAANCSSQNPIANAPFGGKWFDAVTGQCLTGFAFNISYDFSADGITLPNDVIVAVAFNTQHHGYTPTGEPGPYNSLNVSLNDSGSAPSAGIDAEPDAIFWNTTVAGFYTDGGAGGVGTLRRDTNWSPYVLVIQIETFGNDTIAPAVPSLVSPVSGVYRHTSGPGANKSDWTDVTDPSGPVTYWYESSFGTSVDGNGEFVTKAYGPDDLSVSEIDNPWEPEGTYYWHVKACDAVGNCSAWSPSWQINIDNSAPSVLSITAPIAEQTFATTPILNQWTAGTDNYGVHHYQVAYIYDDGHTFGGSTCPGEIIGGNPVSGCRDEAGTSRNHVPSLSEQGGVTIYVRAFDAAGNVSAWSAPVHYYYNQIPVDTTAPSVPVNGLPNGTFELDNEFDFTWDASTDNVPGAITYEFQSSLNPAQSGGVLTTGLWTSGVLPSNMIHSSGAPDGTWYWQVRAKDIAGNVSAWSQIWSMTIDSIAPAVPTHVSPADNTFTTTAAQTSIDWTDVSDVNGPVTYQYQSSTSTATNGDGSFSSPAYTSGVLADSTIPTPGTPEGVYYWHVRAKDAAGNWSAWSTPWKITVDNTAPTVDLVFPTPGPAGTSFQAVFSEEVKEAEAENGANYFLSNWPGAGGSGDLAGDVTIVYNPATKTATVTMTNPGWYVSAEQTWGVQNIHDLAGNLQSVNPYSETSTPMVAPVTTDSGTDANWHNTPVTVTLTCDDGPSTIGSGCKTTYYTTDGSTPTTSSAVYTSPIIISAEGTTTIKYFSVDNAGNAEAVKTVANPVKIDVTNPIDPTSVTSTSHTVNVWSNDRTVDVTWSGASDNLSGVDGYYTEWNHSPTQMFGTKVKEYEEGASSETSPVLSGSGPWYFHIATLDNAGNWTSTAHLGGFLLDTTDPAAFWTEPANFSFVNEEVDLGVVAFDFQSGVKSVGFWFKPLFGFSWIPVALDTSAPYAAEWDTSSLSDGIYLLRAVVKDNANNVTEKFRTVFTDNTAPTTSDSGTDANWHTTDVTVTLSCTDGFFLVSGCDTTYYTTDGTDPTTSSAVYGGSIVISDEGITTIKYFSTDNVGNSEGVKTAAHTVKIDKTAPVVTYSIDPSVPNGDNNWYVSEPQVTLSADDGLLSGVDYIEYSLDNGTTWTTYSTPFSLTDGSWIIQYRAADIAGNVSATDSESAKVDTIDPDEVNNLDAEYRPAPNDDIKLTWDVDDSDIDRVLIYRGGSSGFNVNSSNKIGQNDDNDDTFNDGDVEFGETYYYKLVSVDEAGNHSGSKVIKVEMPTNGTGTATVTALGNEPVAEGTVLGATTNEEGQNGNITETVAPEGSVLGATDENGDTNGIMDFIKKYSWWWLIILLIIGYTSYRYYVAKKENQNPLV